MSEKTVHYTLANKPKCRGADVQRVKGADEQIKGEKKKEKKEKAIGKATGMNCDIVSVSRSTPDSGRRNQAFLCCYPRTDALDARACHRPFASLLHLSLFIFWGKGEMPHFEL